MKIIGVFLILTIHQRLTAEVLVSTKFGDIRGTTRLSRNGKKFDAFLGVPYAEPPIGDLRFQVCIFEKNIPIGIIFIFISNYITFGGER